MIGSRNQCKLSEGRTGHRRYLQLTRKKIKTLAGILALGPDNLVWSSHSLIQTTIPQTNKIIFANFR